MSITLLSNNATFVQPSLIARRGAGGSSQQSKQFQISIPTGRTQSVDRTTALNTAQRNQIQVKPGASFAAIGNLIVQIQPKTNIVSAVGFSSGFNTGAFLDAVVFQKGLSSAPDSADIVPGYDMGEYRRYKALLRESEQETVGIGSNRRARIVADELKRFDRILLANINESPRAIFDRELGVVVNYDASAENAYNQRQQENRQRERNRYQCHSSLSSNSAVLPSGETLHNVAIAVAAKKDGIIMQQNSYNFASVRVSSGFRSNSEKNEGSGIVSAVGTLKTKNNPISVKAGGYCVIQGIGELKAVPFR